MAFMCKQNSISKVILHQKAFGCNFAGKREFTVYHGTFAEGKKTADAKKGSNKQLPVSKAADTYMGVKPSDLDKRTLLWNGNYNSPAEIPEYVDPSKVQMAINTRKLIVYTWILAVGTIALFTVIQCGGRRNRKLLLRIQDEQNALWAARLESNERKLLKMNEKSASV